MTQYLFQKESDVTNDWLFYIENEARSLAQRDEFAIYNYLDREIFNPEMKKFLQSEYIVKMLEQPQDQEAEPFFFNLAEGYETHQIEEYLKPRFSQLKYLVKQIFRETIANQESYQTRDILRKVIYAFIPTFPEGFPAAIFPFIITYSAFMIKYGVKMSYPTVAHY